jgi:hypothetical protein
MARLLGHGLSTIGIGRIGHSLKELGWALRIWWLWPQKTEPNHPWASLHIQVLDKAKALFSVAMQTKIGDGASTLFWSDCWLQGQRFADLVPRLLSTVPKRRINNRTVQEGLAAGKWITDIQGALIVGVITEFLQLWDMLLWDMLLSVELQQCVNDNHF